MSSLFKRSGRGSGVIAVVTALWLVGCSAGQLKLSDDDADALALFSAALSGSSLSQACSDLREVASEGKAVLAYELLCGDLGDPLPTDAQICDKLDALCVDGNRACGLHQAQCETQQARQDGAECPPEGCGAPPIRDPRCYDLRGECVAVGQDCQKGWAPAPNPYSCGLPEQQCCAPEENIPPPGGILVNEPEGGGAECPPQGCGAPPIRDPRCYDLRGECVAVDQACQKGWAPAPNHYSCGLPEQQCCALEENIPPPGGILVNEPEGGGAECPPQGCGAPPIRDPRCYDLRGECVAVDQDCRQTSWVIAPSLYSCGLPGQQCCAPKENIPPQGGILVNETDDA